MKKLAFTLFAVFTAMAASFTATAQTSEQNRQVSGYSGVAISGPFLTHVIIGDKEGVKLTVDENLIDKVETVVDNGTLNVRFKRESNLPWKKDDYNPKVAAVTVYVKTLSAVVSAGSGNTTVDNPVNASDFKITLAGSSAINIASLKVANTVTIRLSGSGTVNIGGSATEVSALISGSGEIKAKGFKTEKTSATISGSGNLYINAEKELNVTMIGSGNVYYTGNAKPNTHKIGSGSISKVN